MIHLAMWIASLLFLIWCARQALRFLARAWKWWGDQNEAAHLSNDLRKSLVRQGLAKPSIEGAVLVCGGALVLLLITILTVANG